MTRERQLKDQANEAAEYRGHNLGRFVHLNAGRVHIMGQRIYEATCKTCGMAVTVNTKPAPNEIDVAGEAVALNCKG